MHSSFVLAQDPAPAGYTFIGSFNQKLSDMPSQGGGSGVVTIRVFRGTERRGKVSGKLSGACAFNETRTAPPRGSACSFDRLRRYSLQVLVPCEDRHGRAAKPRPGW